MLYFDLGIDTFMTYLIGYSLGECKTIFAIPRTYRVQIYAMPKFGCTYQNEIALQFGQGFEVFNEDS